MIMDFGFPEKDLATFDNYAELIEEYVKNNPNPSLGTDDERIAWLCHEHWWCIYAIFSNEQADNLEEYDPSSDYVSPERKYDDDDDYRGDYVEDDSSFYDDCVREAREEEYGEIHDMRNEYATDNDSGWYE